MNALQELVSHIEDRKVIYIKIHYNESWNNSTSIQGTLNQVIPFLNFDYDDGFGTQHIEGTIWYSDGTWSSREECDGFEWWAYRSCPPLPPEASQPPAKAQPLAGWLTKPMTTHELAELLLKEPNQPVKIEDYEGNDFDIKGIKPPEDCNYDYMRGATWIDI